MESLIFAFIAAKHLVARQEPVPAETQSLPPLDLQSLRYVHGATKRSPAPSRDRSDSHLAQAIS
jgi:hypothetical protein